MVLMENGEICIMMAIWMGRGEDIFMLGIYILGVTSFHGLPDEGCEGGLVWYRECIVSKGNLESSI